MNNVTQALIVFVCVILFGAFLVNRILPYGYTESSILYLAGIVGAGFFWIGKKL